MHHRAADGLKREEQEILRKAMLHHFNLGSDALLPADKFLYKQTWTQLWKLRGVEKRAWLAAVKSARKIAKLSRHQRRRKRKGVLVTRGILSLVCICTGFGSNNCNATYVAQGLITGTATVKLRCSLQDTGSSSHRLREPRAMSHVDVSCRTLAGDVKDHIGVVIEKFGIIT